MIILNSKKQLFEDIADQYENYILSGVLKPNEKLPSVRELALQLAINPNTVERAYKLLETRGLIKILFKKGSYVTDTPKSSFDALSLAIDKIINMGYTLDEIKTQLANKERENK